MTTYILYGLFALCVILWIATLFRLRRLSRRLAADHAELMARIEYLIRKFTGGGQGGDGGPGGFPGRAGAANGGAEAGRD